MCVSNDSGRGLRGLLLARGSAFDDAEDVALLHDEEVLAVDAHFGARPLAEQNAVARLHVQRQELAVFGLGAGTGRDHFALLGLFLGRIRNDDAPGSLLLLLDPAHENAVMERAELHGNPPSDLSFFASLSENPTGARRPVSTQAP